jgi:hypothetical protein
MPVMGSTTGLPGRNWSNGTGVSPTKGTGAAGVRNTAKTARNSVRMSARRLIGFISEVCTLRKAEQAEQSGISRNQSVGAGGGFCDVRLFFWPVLFLVFFKAWLVMPRKLGCDTPRWYGRFYVCCAKAVYGSQMAFYRFLIALVLLRMKLSDAFFLIRMKLLAVKHFFLEQRILLLARLNLISDETDVGDEFGDDGLVRDSLSDELSEPVNMLGDCHSNTLPSNHEK